MTETTRIALVTGATDGIGKETATQLTREGCLVIIGARNLEKGAKVRQELADKGIDVDIVELDICNTGITRKAANEIERVYGRLDILVNNAGIALDKGPLSEIALSDLTTTFETNVFGTFRAIQTFLPLLKKSDNACIVNVSSSLGSLTDMTDENSQYYDVLIPAYASSKAALNVLTIHLARELKPLGIKINAVEPGLTATRAVALPNAQPVEVGAQSSVQYALLDKDGPTGGFFDRFGPFRW